VLLLKITAIVNEVGTDWKVKRFLLRQLGLDETSVKELIPKPEEGDDL
jgi:hypothetical protein